MGYSQEEMISSLDYDLSYSLRAKAETDSKHFTTESVSGTTSEGPDSTAYLNRSLSNSNLEKDFRFDDI